MNAKNNTPSFISRDAMIADVKYVNWLSEIKNRFIQSQMKAAVKVNGELLQFYWSLGRDIVNMNMEKVYGKGVMANLSIDLKEAFPNHTGFSVDNLYFMKRWYLFYYKEVRNFDQHGQNFDIPEKFMRVPWRHHVEIIKKTKSIGEAFFYIDKIIEGNWSRRVLEENLVNDLYAHQGAAITNFSSKLPVPEGMLAQEILKDPYNFDFLTIKQDYDEKELEDALVKNITRFLLELGQGFAFVGRQKELRMSDGQSFFPDLIFYHIPQKRYVVVELKAVKFMPEFAGKINFYVTAADKLLRGKNDNPTIGLLICKSYDKTLVEWSLQDIQKPLGVASYQLQQVVDRTVAELNLKNDVKDHL